MSHFENLKLKYMHHVSIYVLYQKIENRKNENVELELLMYWPN